jgi:hypothetical protein
MQPLRGFKIKKRKGMLHWELLLEEWLLANERYCRIMDGEDAPFIYNERSNVGILAGAAWRCGRVSLEEFQQEKGHKNKPKWNGRADLYMASEESEELIEAKFSWLNLRSNEMNTQAKKVLNSAIDDAKKTRGTNPEIRCIGVAFLPVWIPCTSEPEVEEKISTAITSLCELDCHAIAWCFPKEYRRVKSNKGNYTPGVFLIATNCSHL